MFKVGDVIDCVITEIDKEKRLSMSNSAKLAYLPDVAKIIFNKINESLQGKT